MPGRLDGRVALITGGCSGIGEATVKLFLEEGAQVVVADRSGPTDQQQAAIGEGRLVHEQVDVTREDEIAAAFAAADRAFGALDILVNNAGAPGALAKIEDLDAADWDATLALLLRAPMLGVKHAAPRLRKRGGGSIINVASIAGLRTALSAAAAYQVSKAAVLKLTTVAALELAPDMIRVNSILPGAIVTPIFAQGLGLPREEGPKHLPAIEDIYSRAQPLRMTGLPRHIAETALFLASDASAFTTGAEFIVDGGLTLKPAVYDQARAEMLVLREKIFG